MKRLIYLGLGWWGGVGIPASAIWLVMAIASGHGLWVVASIVALVASLAAALTGWGWSETDYIETPRPLINRAIKPQRFDPEYTQFLEFKEQQNRARELG